MMQLNHNLSLRGVLPLEGRRGNLGSGEYHSPNLDSVSSTE